MNSQFSSCLRPTSQKIPGLSFLLSAFLGVIAGFCGSPAALSKNATPPAPPQTVQIPLAGSSITNQAEATYLYAGYTIRLNSNEVAVTVAPVPDFSLTQNNAQRASAGSSVGFPHRIRNTGNTPSRYTLGAANLGGDDYNLNNLEIIRDVNGNGIADPGEPVIAPGQEIALGVNQFADFVVRGVVPVGTAPNASARVEISASLVGGDLVKTNADSITVVAGAAIDVRKGVSPLNVTRGGLATFEIVATSRGADAAAPFAVVVDGAPRNLVFVRDPIPNNTAFVSFGGAPNVNETRLYHRLGDPIHTYTTTPVAPIDAIAWGLPSLPAQNTFRGTFSVRINANATGTITNVARTFYNNPGTTPAPTPELETPSNPVTIEIPILPPVLNYYTNNNYERIQRVTGIGRPLWLQGDAAACNQDPLVAERVTITIRSSLTGDTISVPALETGPNTGIFQVENPIPTSGDAVNPADGTLQTRRDDILNARLGGCGTADATTQILVDPLGVVYDSRTNAPVAGARVTLIDVATGAPAQVFDFDGVTPFPSTVITGADGVYQFPLVAPGNYRLEIVPPAPYSFPSQILPANQPPGRTIDPSGSYGGTFVVPEVVNVVQIDVPLDPPQGPGLFIEKSAISREAEIGGSVDYAVIVRNLSDVRMDTVSVSDVLPLGFTYVPNSARRDSTRLAEPQIVNTRDLTFALGALDVGAQTTLRYRVRVGPGAKTGKNINRARAVGTTPFETFTSNESRAPIEIVGGVFTSRTIIFGRVWIDTNKNGIVDREELGVPGVRIFLEDGTFAVTDGEGKWSIYGVLPLTRVVKLDRSTLPSGAKLRALDTRYARSGESAFADLKNGEMQKVNFALVDVTDAVVADVRTRIAKGEPNAPEIEKGVKAALETTPSSTRDLGDLRSQPATGVKDGARTLENRIDNTAPSGIDARPLRTAKDGPLDGNFGPVASPSVSGKAQSLEEVVLSAAPKLGFVALKDGDTTLSDQINVAVVGRTITNLKLSVNGETLGETRIGTKSVSEARGVQALEFIGVKLRAGSNELALRGFDQFGNERESLKISVTAPGNLGKIRLVLPSGAVQADGQTDVKIGVQLTDDKGIAVNSRTPITLESTLGIWKSADVNPNEPGLQIWVENGRAQVEIQAPFNPGRAAIRASAGILETSGEINFVPSLRPVIAAGIVEGQWGFNASGAARIPTAVFEQELNEFFGKNSGARAAGYVKGRIQGKYLLTMRFDTQDNEDERLFRDIQPDEFYPIYGDSSAKGFDAQSTGKLYVRVDKDNSYVLYGDFSTFSGVADTLNLSRYSRAFNGLQVHGENEKYTASAFLARDNTSRVVREIRGNGTSGPYPLSTGDVRPQSERVELIVRDRNNPGVILSVTPQSRFTDYTLDGFAFGLLFRAPVPSFDADGNPVFIRVALELENNGPEHTTTGISGQVKVNDRTQIGASFVRDNNPDAKMTMMGANAIYRLAKDTVLIGEWANTDTDELGKGSAYRVELRKDSAKLQARVFTGEAARDFNNPESNLTRGRSESGARVSVKTGAKTQVSAEVIRTQDKENGAKTTGAQLAVDHALSNSVRLSGGVRHSKGDAGATFGGSGQNNVDFTSLFARVNARVPGVPQANVFARYERALSDDSQSLSVGGDYQISSRARLYAAHEFFDSPLSLYALGDTQRRYGTRIGIESDYARGASLFSEYRIAGGIDGRSAQAAIGLRNRWALGSGIGLNTSFERTQRLSGENSLGSDDGTAFSLGFESLRDSRVKWSARGEVRNGTQVDSLLFSTGIAAQASKELTWLARGVHARSKSSGETESARREQTRLQLGLAYRPVKSDRFNALAKYEYRDGDDPTTLGSLRLQRRVQLFSTDLNYQPTRSLQARLKYAWKRSEDNTDGIETKTSAHLLSARITKDVSRRLGFSLIGSTLWSGDTNTRQNSLGLEAGYVLGNDLLLSAGYNFSELKDRDLLEENLGKGFYMRLRFKFDEGLFSGVRAFQKAPVPSEAKPFVPVERDANSGVIFDGTKIGGLDEVSGENRGGGVK